MAKTSEFEAAATAVPCPCCWSAGRAMRLFDGQDTKPEEQDRRRIGRERKVLVAERVLRVHRIKRLFCQGIRVFAS